MICVAYALPQPQSIFAEMRSSQFSSADARQSLEQIEQLVKQSDYSISQ